MQTDALFRDVASRVTAMVLNPASQRPYPLSTIERAMRETTGLPAADFDRFAELLTRIRDHIRADGLPKELPF